MRAGGAALDRQRRSRTTGTPVGCLLGDVGIGHGDERGDLLAQWPNWRVSQRAEAIHGVQRRSNALRKRGLGRWRRLHGKVRVIGAVVVHDGLDRWEVVDELSQE